jgi:pimeloyl-ACP methyl ester carboxylesterase
MMRTPIAVALASMLLGGQASAQSIRTGKTGNGIAYDIQGSGPPVVLITGSNLDRRMWDREATWLATSHVVVRYDLRAHGQSDTAARPFSHLDDLYAVLDELEIERATLIGLSAGSEIALDAALDAPGRFDRIVLVGPAPSGYVPREQPAFAADLIGALQARDYKKAAEVLLATPVFAAPPETQALVRRMVTENDRLWAVPREFLKRPGQAAVDRLETVRVPTLILIGENDQGQKEPPGAFPARVSSGCLMEVTC